MSGISSNKFGILLCKQFLEKLEFITEYPESEREHLLQYCVDNEINTTGGVLNNYEDFGDETLAALTDRLKQAIAELETMDTVADSGSGFFNVGKGEA